MQGRASKAPKKELVIESPQQYKSLAEAEVDTVPQVVVSHSSTFYKDIWESSFKSLLACQSYSDLSLCAVL